MGYIPNVQYAPFYVADHEGYFEDAGVRVEFDYALETDAVTRVGAGESLFAIASGEQVLLARAQSIPAVYVMAWFQDFPVAIASPAGSGLRTPADLRGKRIGIPGLFGASYIGYRALLDSAGLADEDVTLEVIGFEQVEALLTGQVDAVVVYANNEPIQLTARGTPVDLVRVSDYVQLASNGLITNETTRAQDPDLVRRLVAAVVRGIEMTLQEPDAAYRTTQSYVPGLGDSAADVQRQVLEASLPYWESARVGLSSPEAWTNMQSVLLSMGLLETPISVEEAFTNEFVP
jgi:NitT/TauT family transport system substrate-binding protein